MATQLPVTALNGTFPLLANIAASLVFTTGDPAGNFFPLTGKEVILMQNGGSTGSHNVTITSQKDSPMGRLGDVVIPVAQGAIRAVGPLATQPGWKDATGMLNLTPQTVDIAFCILQFP